MKTFKLLLKEVFGSFYNPNRFISDADDIEIKDLKDL